MSHDAPLPADQPHPFHRVLTWLGVTLPFIVLAAFFFGGSFVQQKHFVFRDTAHFYLPLFHEVTRQWKAGEIPLWSPWDGIGIPLAADATPSVFYPGKLLFLTPLGFDFGMRAYVVVHYLIAYVGIFAAARAWKASRVAAVLAAVCYTFGGPLLSYHSNIIFLVGSSWLPLAAMFGWKLVRRPALPSGIGLALCLTMMILGGDPQLAFLTMMMLSLAAVCYALPWRTNGGWNVWIKWRTFRMGALVGSALLAFCLSAIQILPTSEWASRSVRAVSTQPRNIYELATKTVRGEQPAWDSLLGNPPAGTHARHSYDFSIGPWTWPETFIANFSGKLYPRNQRWTRAIPAEGRIWFQSIFLGSLVTLLAAVAIFARSSRQVDRWLVGIALFGILASLGWYGLGWLLLEIDYAVRGDGSNLPVGSPFGGLYWLLNILVPKFAQFRYPAKWWIFVALAVSLLAGRGLDTIRVSCGGFRWAMRLTVVGVIIGGGLLVASPWLAGVLPSAPNDQLFGPLDAESGLWQMTLGVLQGVVAIALGMAAFYFLPRRLATYAVIVIVGAELAIGNGWIIATAPQQLWYPNGFQQTDESLKDRRTDYASYLDPTKNHYPPGFATSGSDDRMAQGMTIDRQSAFPRYGLLGPWRTVPAVVSIRSRDYEGIWNAATTEQQSELVQFMFGTYPISPRTFPNVWWQNQVQWHAPVDNATVLDAQPGTREILDQMLEINMPVLGPNLNANFPSSYHMAWDKDYWYPAALEAEEADRLVTPKAPSGAIVLTRNKRDRAGEISTALINCEDGWVIFREYFDPGWQCEIVSKNGQVRTGVTIYRANRIMMAVPVQAGDQMVTLTYWPRSFVIGASISAASWLLLVGLFVARQVRRHWPTATKR